MATGIIGHSDRQPVTVTMTAVDWQQIVVSVSHDISKAHEENRIHTARALTKILERLDAQLPYERV